MARKESRVNSIRRATGAKLAPEHPTAISLAKSITNKQILGLTSDKGNLFSYDVNIGKKGSPDIGYQSLIKENRFLRKGDAEAVEAGLITKKVARHRDRIRQMRLYEHMVKTGIAGKGTISTIELAKSLNAIAQEKGIIPNTSDIAIGIHRDFLRDKLAVRNDKTLNRKLLYSIEEIKAGRVPKGLHSWAQSHKDPTKLRVAQETKNILKVKKELNMIGRSSLFSGTELTTNYKSFRDRMINAKTSQGFRFGEYAKSGADIFASAEAKAGIKYNKTIDTIAGKLPRGLGRSAMILGGTIAASYLLSRTLGISGKDDDYNSIEGLQHGWFGSSRKHITDFGSGFNMDRINTTAIALRNPVMAEAIMRDRNSRENKETPGDFSKMDLMLLGDQATLEGLNRRRKELREVKLASYSLMVDDADTLVLNKKGSSDPSVQIRMSGIDAPETAHLNDPLKDYRVGQRQPLGDISTKRLKQILGNKEDLRLVVDPTERTYGRYLGVLFKGNKNVNLQLAEEGYASSLEFGSQHRDAVNRGMFMAAGDKAEREGLGIWGHDFFKDWKSFSAGYGKDVTFNSFTDLLRLARNKHLAAGAAEMWEDGYNQGESYRQGALYQMSNQFSAKDGTYNSINAMSHKWFGLQRKANTDFGSGYKGLGTKHEDPTPVDWLGLGTVAGAIAGARFLWNKEVNFFGKTFDISKLSYMGVGGDFLGRQTATYKDFAYNAIRRSELALGGIPKAFSVSTMMSPSILKNAKFEVDLGEIGFDPIEQQLRKTKSRTLKQGVGYGYEQYLTELTGKTKKTFGIGTGSDFERFKKVSFEGGKLFGITGTGQRELLLGEARLFQRVHDKNISESVAQFAKSYENIFNIKGVGDEHGFLIGGGKTKRQAMFRAAHAFGHETLSKYIRLVKDPGKAMRELTPALGPLADIVDKFTGIMPNLGVPGKGEEGLIGSLPTVFARHGKQALPLLLGLPALFGTANWLTRQLSPEDSVAGQAGLTGIAAETARLAHMTYAGISDITGLTDIKKYGEEKAPGLTGFKPWLGFTLSGMLTGTALGMGKGIYEEMKAPAGQARYEAMIKAKTAEKGMHPELKKLPGMGSKYTKAIRWGKHGGLAMAALAAPFLLFGLGSSKSREELDEEYLGGKEVAIKKARWWEFGTTPWEGERTMYYRPNWYNRILDRPTEKSIYGGEDISPVGKFMRTLADPYWLEKEHYEDRPYPIAGSSGEGLGLFGPLYEWTIGRVMKPPMFMHPEAFGGHGHLHGDSGKYTPSKHLAGALPAEEAMTPYSAAEQMKQQYYTTYEAVGLRGFVASAIKETITGEQDVFEHMPILQSSADIDSTRRKFWDMNLGGLLGMTEPYRRFVPKRPYTTEYVNPIKNTMPSWMPGEDYFLNFQEGDPFTKVAEGEYRLPGVGYAARYKELEGISPEKYPLIHKYKILADIAPYSREFRQTRKELEEYQPTDYEAEIFEETEKQLEDKRTRKKFRDDVYDETILGRYGAALVDIARGNPLEQLTPLAPAHKLLPPSKPISSYEESIYGKEFKLWQRPIDDYIKPFATSLGNLVGIDRIPTEIQEARQIEGYFDRLEYVKNKRLEMQAHGRGAEGRAKHYKNQSGRTLAGADVYANDFRLMAALPKREKVYYQQFKEASSSEKERLLEIIPENMKDLYIAQWDKILLQDMQEGKLELNETERYNLEREIFNRMTTIRSRRQAEGEALQSSEKLPDENWIGWRADVDLEDVKLKYLIQAGRDFHYYDLWDDRLRGLRRKPYLDEALDQIEPLDELAPDMTYEQIYRQAIQAGIQNPEIIQREGIAPSVSYNLEYDRNNEIYDELRAMGEVI